MNIELWNKGVDWIVDNPGQYNQGQPLSYSSDGKGGRVCGSPCCFFGAVAIVAGVKPRPHNAIPNLKYTVAALMEIKSFESDLLFSAYWPKRWFIKAGLTTTPKFHSKMPTENEAVAILRGMAEEGRVWSIHKGEEA